ncbi:MAG: hypothetical protein ABW051_08090, partial [Burkholderiaceae bacterium]
VIDPGGARRNHTPTFNSNAKEPVMAMTSSSNFMRNVLIADSISCLGSGALQVAFTGAMASLLGLPAQLLMASGVFLLAYGAFVGWLSTRRPAPRPIIWLLVVGNLGWAAGCLLLLVSGYVAPTALGVAWVVIQELTVSVLAQLQWLGLRATSSQAWA